MMKRNAVFALFILTLCVQLSCSKPIHGRYYANEECFLLEWMEVYPDNTADLKYRGLSEEFNVPCHIEDDTVIVVKERNRTWYWVYRRDTLREGSHIDSPGCRMAKRP
jgi:hypothetical protein